MRALEYWFDFSCPYAYLASTQVRAVAERTGAALRLRPFLLGGVFRALEVPQNLAASLSPLKAAHNAQDLRRYAQLYGVELRFPTGHPRRTVTALRALLAAAAGAEPSFELMRRFFAAYWVEGKDLSRREVVAAVLADAGLEAERLLAAAEGDAIKDELRRRTDEAVARGIFGAPAFFVEGALYFGQDRLDQVEAALGGRPAPLPGPEDSMRPVHFWFDYSSPFTYIASTRVERLLGGAVRFHPMLLGGLFKAVGTPNVPMFEMSAPKRAFAAIDMERQAAEAGAPFRFPGRFPMNTVLALRLTLAAGDPDDPAVRRLIHRLFRAYWAEDQDLAAPDTLAALASEVGLDGRALLEGAGSPPVKEALRAATDQAAAQGIFGAPSFVVELPEERPLYWGNDRLSLVRLAALGDRRAV